MRTVDESRRKTDAPLLTGAEAMEMVLAGMFMDKGGSTTGFWRRRRRAVGGTRRKPACRD